MSLWGVENEMIGSLGQEWIEGLAPTPEEGLGSGQGDSHCLSPGHTGDGLQRQKNGVVTDRASGTTGDRQHHGQRRTGWTGWLHRITRSGGTREEGPQHGGGPSRASHFPGAAASLDFSNLRIFCFTSKPRLRSSCILSHLLSHWSSIPTQEDVQNIPLPFMSTQGPQDEGGDPFVHPITMRVFAMCQRVF